MTFFAVEAAVVAAVAVAKALNSNSNAIKVICRVPDCPSNLAHASPVKSVPIMLRTVK